MPPPTTTMRACEGSAMRARLAEARKGEAPENPPLSPDDAGQPHGRPLPFPDHPQVAAAASRPAAAVLAADAERREDLDRARGDRAAVRGAQGRLREERPDLARIPVAEPEQQDPGDPRPERPGRPAAGAVRVGGDPRLPG